MSSMFTNLIPFAGPFMSGGVFNQNNGPTGSPGNLQQYGNNPYASPLLTAAQNFQGPTSISAPTNSYQAQDESTVDLPQYDAMRTRLNTQYSQNQGQAQDAIDRQFAAMGGGPGNGAQLKQTENLAQNTEAQKSQDLEGINAQEASTRQQMQQQQNQEAFQSGESTRQMQFGASEFNTQAQQQAQAQQFGEFGQVAGLNTSWDEAQQQAANDAYNQSLSQFQAQHTGGLLGGGGFLGLGI